MSRASRPLTPCSGMPLPGTTRCGCSSQRIMASGVFGRLCRPSRWCAGRDGRLRHEADAKGLTHLRIDEAPAQRRVLQLLRTAERRLRLQHERCADHVFDAAGSQQFRFAATDCLRRAADGAEDISALPIDRRARHHAWQSGERCGHARDVAIFRARLIGAAEQNVVGRYPIHAGMTLDQDPQRSGGKVVGADRSQRNARTADRRRIATQI